MTRLEFVTISMTGFIRVFLRGSLLQAVGSICQRKWILNNPKMIYMTTNQVCLLESFAYSNTAVVTLYLNG